MKLHTAVGPITCDDLAFLGAGKAGEVYRARLRSDYKDLAEGSYIAVKKYRHWLLEEPEQRERLRREATVTQRLRHPNVVRILGLEDGEGGPVLLMEYVPGESLRIALPTLKIEWQQLAQQLLAGLAMLHRSGVVHRDIKPENIILTDTGLIKIADFGVAKPSFESSITATDQFLGTIRYAAPEYLFENQCTSQADQYSAGAVLYEVVQKEPLVPPVGGFAKAVLAIKDADKRKRPRLNARIDSLEDLVRLFAISRLLREDSHDRFEDTMDAYAAMADGYRSGWWELRVAEEIATSAWKRRRNCEYEMRLSAARLVREALDVQGVSEKVINRAIARKKELDEGDGENWNLGYCEACSGSMTYYADLSGGECELCGFTWGGYSAYTALSVSPFEMAVNTCQSLATGLFAEDRSLDRQRISQLVARVADTPQFWWTHQ